MEMTEKRERITSFDVLRVLACLFVITYHTYITPLGRLGVSIFFVMSGFLCAYNYLGDGDIARLGPGGSAGFALGKIKKLYPLHIIMLAYPLATRLYGVVNGLLPARRFFAELAANVFLVHAWIPRVEYYFSLNATSWYLSVMLFLYFMLPLVLRCMGKYRGKLTAAVVIALVFLAQILSSKAAADILIPHLPGLSDPMHFYEWFTYIFPVYRLGDFVIGCNLAYIFVHCGKKKVSRPLGTVLELAALALLLLSQLYLERRPYNSTCVYLPATAFTVYVFAFGGGYVSRLSENKVIKHISALSSDIFLIHPTCIMVSSLVATSLPVGTGAQKALFLTFTYCGTYVLSLASHAIRKKYRRFT